MFSHLPWTLPSHRTVTHTQTCVFSHLLWTLTGTHTHTHVFSHLPWTPPSGRSRQTHRFPAHLHRNRTVGLELPHPVCPDMYNVFLHWAVSVSAVTVTCLASYVCTYVENDCPRYRFLRVTFNLKSAWKYTCFLFKERCRNWRRITVADLGFSRLGGTNFPGGGGAIYDFTKISQNCMKSKEFEGVGWGQWIGWKA